LLGDQLFAGHAREKLPAAGFDVIRDVAGKFPQDD
jgi:hypothetical protein